MVILRCLKDFLTNKFLYYIMYNEYLDHHSENYKGFEGAYNGMDKNDYEFERALKNIGV